MEAETIERTVTTNKHNQYTFINGYVLDILSLQLYKNKSS